MDNRRALSIVLLPLAIGLVTTTVRAQSAATTATPTTPAPRSPAEQHFFTGKGLYVDGKTAEALVEFRASFADTRSPNSRLYVARCLRDLGDVAAAYEEYAQVIVDAADRTESGRYAPTQKAATEERAALRDKVATLVLVIPDGASGASVEIGGALIEPARLGSEITVGAGKTVVHAIAPGRQAFDITVDLAPGDTRRVSIELPLVPPPPVAIVAPIPPPPAPPEKHEIPLRPLAYASVGISAAGFMTWAVLGLIAKSQYTELETQCGGRCPPSLQGRVDAGRTESTLSAVGLAFGLTGLAGAGALWYLDVRKSRSQKGEKATLAIVPTPLGAVISGTFQ